MLPSRYLRAQGVSSPAARARKKSTEIDSGIYSLGFGNRETRVDFFALSIPILSYNSCFRPIQRASFGGTENRDTKT